MPDKISLDKLTEEEKKEISKQYPKDKEGWVLTPKDKKEKIEGRNGGIKIDLK